MTATDSLEAFARALPKTETHLHLEGALPYAMLRELDPERFPDAPAFLRPGYRFEDFVTFENTLIEHAVAWFTSIERYREACKRIFRDLQAQNVVYLETSIHLAIIEFIGVDGRELLAAIKSAVPEGMEVRVVGGLLRNGYTPSMAPVIDQLHEWEELDGIDMHGQEWLPVEPWTGPVWRRCREAGKLVKFHAGEFGGPENVVHAMEDLGVRHIQHGVRAADDRDLVKRLADEGVVLDMCPISNYKLRVFDDWGRYPLARFLEAGVCCTVSTDDPLCFGNTITQEYLTLAERLGLGRAELVRLARNGIARAAVDEARRGAWLAKLHALAET